MAAPFSNLTLFGIKSHLYKHLFSTEDGSIVCCNEEYTITSYPKETWMGKGTLCLDLIVYSNSLCHYHNYYGYRM